MSTVLERELSQLREQLLLMGDKTEEAIEQATRALVEHDLDLARRVIAGDDVIDAMELEIEWACMRVLALRSPEARDLRFVMAVNRLIPILERIADHGCNLAQTALALGPVPKLETNPDFLKMSRIVCEMLRASLDSFAASDAAAARAVIDRDDAVNELYDRIFHHLLAEMSRDPSVTNHAARLVLVAKHLERVGDYITDICEQIVYLKEARVIKHQRLST